MPPGYLSATEYQFNKEQADAIVRTASYHRRPYFSSVIWFTPSEHDDVRPWIATPFQRTSNAGLGSLDQLPTELLHDILFRLDLYSLLKLRQTNLRSRQTIDSLKKYQVLVSHGLNLFCALLRTRIALQVSLSDFYDALCTKVCSLCGEFGGFMSLLTWKRCCFDCLRDAPEIRVRTLASVRKQFRINKAELAQMNSFKTLPGEYTLDDKVLKSRVTVVSIHQASLICRQPLPVRGQSDFERIMKYNFMGSCALPYYDKTTGDVEYGVSCAGCELALGISIARLGPNEWLANARDKVYARDGFLKHFQWCEQAQLLWRTSDEGSKRPPELPIRAYRMEDFRRCGWNIPADIL
ncbi:hypothetical protein FPOAC1_007807 [Fusarium poae]|jgi:hypothetical protein|nr:hypothetical protein FPOAC1_007807 [Fusarium poae]KAG8668428.1 hypothetical protein FPOAC1_007807 [Fusarium poae]